MERREPAYIVGGNISWSATMEYPALSCLQASASALPSDWKAHTLTSAYPKSTYSLRINSKSNSCTKHSMIPQHGDLLLPVPWHLSHEFHFLFCVVVIPRDILAQEGAPPWNISFAGISIFTLRLSVNKEINEILFDTRKSRNGSGEGVWYSGIEDPEVASNFVEDIPTAY